MGGGKRGREKGRGRIRVGRQDGGENYQGMNGEWRGDEEGETKDGEKATKMKGKRANGRGGEKKGRGEEKKGRDDGREGETSGDGEKASRG